MVPITGDVKPVSSSPPCHFGQVSLVTTTMTRRDEGM